MSFTRMIFATGHKDIVSGGTDDRRFFIPYYPKETLPKKNQVYLDLKRPPKSVRK